MSIKNARIACTALTKRIMLGNIAKDGMSFTDTKRDVTSDCLKAVIEFVGEGNEATVTAGGRVAYTITVQAISDATETVFGNVAQPVQPQLDEAVQAIGELEWLGYTYNDRAWNKPAIAQPVQPKEKS